MLFEQIPAETILFFILYGITGVVPLIAALYLLLRRGNAFADDITPPVRLRRWAASFFGVLALGHVWWYLFYINSSDIHSVDNLIYSAGYVTCIMLDSIAQLTTIAGTLLAMLQDRKRSLLPVFAATLLFAVLGGVLLLYPSMLLMQIATAYILLLYVLFTIYMTVAVRQYGRWLHDNYADLEHKEVWRTHLLALIFLLLFIFYALIDSNIVLIYLLHFIELTLFIFLLWRVETLPCLTENSVKEEECCLPAPEDGAQNCAQKQQPPSIDAKINLTNIAQKLTKNCVETKLYLQHNLTLQQLAQVIGTNRTYLSQYFSSQGITYNTYINNLRIKHFISQYQEITDSQQPFTLQQLASDSGYHSYSTFSLAFKQRMGLSVTAWLRDMGGGGN